MAELARLAAYVLAAALVLGLAGWAAWVLAVRGMYGRLEARYRQGWADGVEAVLMARDGPEAARWCRTEGCTQGRAHLGACVVQLALVPEAELAALNAARAAAPAVSALASDPAIIRVRQRFAAIRAGLHLPPNGCTSEGNTQ
jgi:hypothetical protein